MEDETRVSDATRKAEEAEMAATGKADRMPTEDEEQRAEQQELDPEVAKEIEEQYERGAKVKGEGEITPS